MTVFKAYLKILNKNKFLVILYTIILIFFAVFQMQTNETGMNFKAEKPDVAIVSEEEETGITKHLIEYIKNNSHIVELKESERADALFYRDVNYIIYIPKNFRSDFLNGKNPKIDIQSTGDYQASLAHMILDKYLKTASIYQNFSEEEIIDLINKTLQKEATIEITSKLDTDHLTKASFFYNFANYSILAGCIYIICFIISSFKTEKIKKRTMISSMNYKKHNRYLLLSNSLFALTLWLFYVILSFLLVGDVMVSLQGLLMILNSFVFTISALSLAFLIGNLISNKEAISGLVNVIALGSSFLCGAFVPTEFLPEIVLKIAHIFPSYYYINNNELLSKLEGINVETLHPILINVFFLLSFIVIFVIMTNIISKKKNHI